MKILMNSKYQAFAVFAFACFALSEVADAQCPQICDSNDNTAVGNSALISNTTGSDNTAVGSSALLSSSTGEFNTAIGFEALSDNTIGDSNTATGYQALTSNTIGVENTATGIDALEFNTTGSLNTAAGYSALLNNTSGRGNTAYGEDTLTSNTTGNNNIAIGNSALALISSGNNNIAIGYTGGAALTAGTNNIDIGNMGVPVESGTIRIGTAGIHKKTFIAGISGVTVANGVGVIINTQGQLGTVVSSARYKEAIKPMDKASETILSLKPVTFRYKHDLDPDGILQFGLVAEQVEKVNPALVARDEQGKPYTVRYEAVNAMLLNEFLKEHVKVEKLEAALLAVNSRLAEQDAKIQKVSAQLELSKTAPQTVLNDPR
jgi:hypothetical protein